MTLIRAFAFLLHFTIVPIAVGRLITYRTKSKWIESYLIGFFGNLAIFYVLYSILEWRQNWTTIVDPVTGAFTALTSIYSGIILIALVLWSILRKDKIKKLPARIKFKIYGTKQKIMDDKYSIIYILIVVALLLVQLYMAYAYEINEWSYDDYDYVVTSNDTISSDTISYVNFIDGSMPKVSEKRAVASWGTYVALLAKTSGFEVTTVYHTILPVLLLLVAYLNFYYISRILFVETDNRMIFLIILSLGYIFGLYSHYSATFRLLGAIWQGKAVLSIIAVPFFTVYLFDQYKKEYDREILLPIISVSLGICSLTSQALLFVTPIAFFVWILMCIYHRKIYRVRYLLASIVGPVYLCLFYMFIYMLQHDMTTHEYKYFWFRNSNK